MPMPAGLAEHEWNGMSNKDDSASLGSSHSVDSWELHFDELREHMRIDYPAGGFVNVGRCSPLLGDWISRQRIQYHRKGCGYACPLSDDRIQKLEDIGFWWDHEHPGQEIIETSPPPDTVGALKKLEQKKKGTPRRSKERSRCFELNFKSHMNSGTGANATAAFHYFLAENRSKLERSLNRSHRYFSQLPKGYARNEVIAKEAKAWWSMLKQSEIRRYMDMSTQDMDQGAIEPDDGGPKMSQSDADATATPVTPTPSRPGEKNLKTRWRCDFCKAKHFEDLEEACAHEKQCEKQMKDEQQKKLLREQQEQKQTQEKEEMRKQQQVTQQEKQKAEVQSERTIHKEAPNTPQKEQRTDSSNRGLNRKQSPEALKHGAKKQRTDVPWEANYERLVKYVENHGSGYILPPRSDLKFYNWVSIQRSIKKRSRMPSDRISKLESIGFLWEKPSESAAKESFSGEDYLSGWETQEEESSHCSTQSLPDDDESTDTAGDAEQANHNTPSTIHEARNPAPRKHRMNALHRDLERKQRPETPKRHTKKRKTGVPWETNYARLVKYVEDHGSGYILPPTSDSYFSKWVGRQRSIKKCSEMSSDRISKLESIGFLWEKPDESTAKESCKSKEDASGRRTRDKETHHSSNCNSPADDESLDTARHLTAKSSGSEGCTIEEQVSREAARPQNKHRRRKAATKKQKPDPYATWEENYERLVKYADNHGSGYICPPTSDMYFYRWVHRQRSDKKRSTMSSYRISKLESIGFVWEKPDGSTAKESCKSKEDASGLQAQEKESHHSSRCITDSSPDDNESLDTAGNSTAMSGGSERSVIDKRVSKAATRSHGKRKSLKATTTSVDVDYDTDVDYDAEINDNLAQISRCLQKKTLTQKRRERAWKTKYTTCKESLRKSEKQVLDLRGQSQNSKKKVQAEIHELNRKVEQLKKQNDILTKKAQVGTIDMKQRYLALQQAHKIERERRMEAEAKLKQVTNLLSG